MTIFDQLLAIHYDITLKVVDEFSQNFRDKEHRLYVVVDLNYFFYFSFAYLQYVKQCYGTLLLFSIRVSALMPTILVMSLISIVCISLALRPIAYSLAEVCAF